ncbi:MAG: response regulator transcription factor [Pseudomonadota bacterium]
MPADPIRILLVDDHAIARAGVCAMLEQCRDLRVAGEADSASRALELASAGQFDVAVLDISLPDQSGLELLPALRSAHPALKVIMLSSHAEDMYGVRALRLGAAGYLNKNAPATVLQTAVREVAGGATYLSASLRERLALAACAGAVAEHEQLSTREFDVMKRIASGQSLVDIGEALFLSPKTITTHRTRILEKLGMSSNAQLTRYAIEHSLL